MASNGVRAPRPPAGLRASGRALWKAVLADFELTEHETVLFREACRTADSLDALQTTLDQDGVMSESSQGIRVHPALVELRQQRIALARILAALHIPTEDSEGHVPHRGVRGVYGIGSAS